MDTSDPGVTFDENGVCCYCKLYDQRVSNEVFRGKVGEERLKAIVGKVKKHGEGKPYDCLIGVSGGVDSTYVLWNLKKEGLRPLALHLDNGWNSELAVDNIKNTLDRLEIDLLTYVLDWEEFRDLQLSFLKASVPNAEIPTDHAIGAINFQIALKHGIKYIFNGGNVATEAFVPVAWAYDARDQRHLKAIHKKFGSTPLRNFPTMGILDYAYTIFFKGIRWITLLNYVNYQKSEAVKVLERELGWRPYSGKHFESVYTRFYQGYILKHKFGFDKKRAHLANLVLSGDMTREQAMAEVQKEDYIGTNLYFEDREFAVKKLALTDTEFEEIMALPVRTHYDFPNNSWALERMPRLFKTFKRFVTRI
jgi:N-acetyl sugar amidotransferase